MSQNPLLMYVATKTGVPAPLLVDSSGYLKVVAETGSLEAVTIVDGGDVTQGAKADAAWTTGSGSVVALLKAMATKIIATVGITVASGGIAAGSMVAGAAVDGHDLTQGAVADAAWTSGSGSVIALLKAMAAKIVATVTTQPAGFSSYNTASNTAGYAVKTGAGVWNGLIVNTAGLTSAATFYDGTSTGGTKLATASTLAVNSNVYSIAFTTGLFVVLTGGTPADVTITYR